MWPFRNIEDAFATAEKAAGQYDYIVVGGGTAGCVLSRRLSEDRSTKVLLLERGNATEHFTSRIPVLSHYWTFGSSQGFKYKSTASTIMDGREQEIIGGRALGGATRVNGMMYTRGVSGEFNEWAAEGRTGWAYNDIEPFFKKSQNCLDPTVESYQGHEGPLTTKRTSEIYFGSVQRTKDAALRLGIPNVIDANSPDESAVGITHIHQTITEQGQRNSADHAFLPLQYRQTHPNLTVCTSALARKIDISSTEGGVRASGVFFQAVDGKSVYHAKARKEVVLSCGAIFSPQLLMLSGIGPNEHLADMGIPVQKDLPGVGSSIQDHMGISVDHAIPLADSWIGLVKRPWMLIVALFMYLFWGTGAFTVPPVEVAAFMRSELIDDKGNYIAPIGKQDPRDPNNCPDFEIMVTPSADPSTPGFDWSKGSMAYLISILRPQSTGTLRLKSSDPSEFPTLDLGSMSDPKDYQICRSALRLAMRLGQEVKKTGYLIEPFSIPKSFEDADLDEFTRQRGKSIYHYCASCRMAPEGDSPRAGVVDNELRVHGVQGLRIADSSVLPRASSAHPMASVIMVAEKCADMLLKA